MKNKKTTTRKKRQQLSLMTMDANEYKKLGEEAKRHHRSVAEHVVYLLHGYINGEWVSSEDLAEFMRKAVDKGIDLAPMLGSKKLG